MLVLLSLVPNALGAERRCRRPGCHPAHKVGQECRKTITEELSGESVTLFPNGENRKEYFGELERKKEVGRWAGR